MNLSPESVKKTLLNKVNELSASSWQYTKKPTDFTKNRKISFSDVLLSTISMQKSASKTELLKYFDFNASAPTASALIQQRKKISPEAFDSLFYSFSNAFFLDKTLKGYDPIAVDGSDIYIPRNPKDPDTYRVTDRYNKGFNMIHLNAAYNLLSHLYTDVILQPLNHINEYIAMCDIIDHYTATNPTRKPLFIADRGLVSFNVFAHAIENNAYFLVRARESNPRSMLATIKLPDSPEYDIIFERWLTRKKTKTVKAEPEVYKTIANRTFDYLDPKSKSLYYISFRIVSFVLPNGNTEVVYTNLPKEDFSTEELRELYNMRWGIETSFRDIKYAAGLLFFHSRKKDLVIQEIYAKLILYNFCELITGAIVVEKKDRKYSYRINFSIAIAICTEFLRRSCASPPIDVIALIGRELIAVRPDRRNPRYLRARTATTFQYR